VVNFQKNGISSEPLKDVRLIEVPYISDEEYSRVFNANKSENNWTVEDNNNEQYHLKLLGFYMYGIYKG